MVDIIAAMPDESRDDKFYLIVRLAVLIMEEEDLPDIKFIDEMKHECGIFLMICCSLSPERRVRSIQNLLSYYILRLFNT